EKLRLAMRVPTQVKTALKEQCAKGEYSPCLKKCDGVPVHQLDVHLEKGMHCVDCHFVQDAHGNGKLYGEVRAAIEIQCTDCHGTITKKPTLRTSGPARADGANGEPDGRDLTVLRTPSGARRFEWRGDRRFQNSM